MISARQAFEAEWQQARTAWRTGDLNLAFHHLERSHILGQRHTWLHVRSHLGMGWVGWLRSDAGELLGQAMRVLAALLFSSIWVPAGNTGGANVNPFKPMSIPPDLADILRAEEFRRATQRNR
ncbi:DUF3703 domain-containing protein [Pseudomarimonas arenosa]|uniref:DUF3703 domain-containing protein n=1 Tax=Pseudomarimonas arenosa TaxID=2774145 RepID=UPI002FC37A4C